MLQQIDKAVTPDYRSFPPRMLVVAGGAFAGLLLGAGWIVLRRYAALMRQERLAAGGGRRFGTA